MKKFFILFFLFVATVSFAQTINIPISKDIQIRNGEQFYVHTVQKGQTVYSIAKAYNVEISVIYYYNPGAKTGILIGQKLWIPTENKATEITKVVKQKNFDFFYHVASAGETIDHIASIYLIPKRYILLANPGLKGPMKEGEFVKIPVEDAYKILDDTATTVSSTKTYTSGLNKNSIFSPPVEKPIVTTEKQATSRKQISRKVVNANSWIPIIKNYRHVVVQGETMLSISRKYKISVAELRAVNPGLIHVARGMQLRLPINAQVPGYHASKTDLKEEASAFHNSTHAKGSINTQNQQQKLPKGKFIKHIVKKGETLYSISRKYGVSLNDLYQANIGLSASIKTGQQILIPKKKMNKAYVFYSPIGKIKFKKVARLYRINFRQLKQENASLKRFIFPGQIVKVPVEKTIGAPIAPGNRKTQGHAITEVSPAQPFPGRCSPAPHNRTFKVAVMIPLYLEYADSLDRFQFMMQPEMNFAPFQFIRFLEGALLASKTMKAEGMNLKLYVYDVDQTLAKTYRVLSRPKLKDMNLIIGPFYSRSFSLVSLFAEHFKIPIVNPLTFRETILNNHKGVIKVKPGFRFQPSLIKKLVRDYYSKDKVFILSQSAFKDTKIVNIFRDSIQQVLPDSIKFSNARLVNLGIAVTQRERKQEQLEQEANQNPAYATEPAPPIVTTINDTLRPYFLENQLVYPDSLKEHLNDSTVFANPLVQINFLQDNLRPFMDNASVLRKNLVIVYGTNKAFVMNVMNKLNVLSDTFNVKMIGLPRWETISNMEVHQMNNLNVTYPASYYVNYESPGVKNLDSLFMKNYATIPEKYGILGYDITRYFLHALYYYGKQMNECLPNDPYQGLSTKFHFAPSSQDTKDYENTYWNLIQIRNMRLIKLPDSLVPQPNLRKIAP